MFHIFPTVVLWLSLLSPCRFVFSAAKDEKTSSFTLPFGDVNVLVVTDVHSWVAGHNQEHEPYLNVDYGTVLSFYETLQGKANEMGKDLFFVMNGDFMDGTGLSLEVDQLFPILERMPFSALNMGNHELFFNDNLLDMRRNGFLDHWQGKYLTSNTVWADTELPIGHQFTYLTSRHFSSSVSLSPKNILVFGFLYNFEDACSSAKVERVQDVVQQQWFIDVLKFNRRSKNAMRNETSISTSPTAFSEASYKDYDAILVLAHMDHQDPLIQVIRTAIRAITGDANLPIQFIAGHTHIRGFSVLDKMFTSFEAGRFLDTIGFVSFPWQKESWSSSLRVGQDDEVDSTVGDQDNKTVTSTESEFRHVFLDANREVLLEALGAGSKNLTVFQTGHGRALTHFIEGKRSSMGLNEVVGCSGGRYRLDLPLDDPRSLWGLYVREVIPHALANNHSRIFIQRTLALRYDMLVGPVTVDDAIAVSPIRDRMVRILEHVEKKDLLLLLAKLNVSSMDEKFTYLPRYGISPWPHPIHNRGFSTFELFAMERDWPFIRAALSELGRVDNSSFFAKSWEEYEPEIYRGGISGMHIQTSHGVWIDFVKDNWKCTTSEMDMATKLHQQLLIWLCGLTALIGLVHYYTWIKAGVDIDSDRPSSHIRIAGVTVPRQNMRHSKYVMKQHYKNLRQQPRQSQSPRYDHQPMETSHLLPHQSSHT